MGTPQWTEEILNEAIRLRSLNPPVAWKNIAAKYQVDPYQLQITVHRFKNKKYIPGPRRNAADYEGVERMFRQTGDLKKIADHYGVSKARISVMLDRVGLTSEKRQIIRHVLAVQARAKAV
jgi:hypothetical protein